MANKNIISPPQPNQKLDQTEEKELRVKEDELNREIADLDAELKKLSLNAQFVNEINQIPEPDPFYLSIFYIFNIFYRKNQTKNDEDLPILNRKGEIVIDNEEIKRRYTNSFPIIRFFFFNFCGIFLILKKKKKFSFAVLLSKHQRQNLFLDGVVVAFVIRLQRKKNIRFLLKIILFESHNF